MNQMVRVRKGGNFDTRETLRRSPVANLPGADKTLRAVLDRSIVYQGLIDDEVACVWGLIPPSLLSNTAYIWLLTTDIVAMHKFIFVRYSQLWVEDALSRYEVLVGDVILPDPHAVRWLKWLGAEFDTPVDGRLPFIIRRKNV